MPSGKGATIGAAALAVVRTEADRLAELRAAVLASDDPEAVHALRVSIRKVRTAIRAFGTLLPSTISALDGGLSALFDELGEVRDRDITIALWLERGDSDPAAVEVLIGLETARSGAKLGLTVSLAKNSALDKLAKAGSRKPLNSPAALAAVEPAAGDSIVAAHRKAHKAAGRLSKAAAPEDIHRFRRRLKRLRYAVEFFAETFGKPADEFVEHLKKLQDLLGDHQDTVLVERVLRSVPDLSEGARGYIEPVIHDTTARRATLRRKILRSSGQLDGKRWKRLHRELRAH